MSDHPAAVPTCHVVALPEVAVGLVEAFVRGLPSTGTRKVYRRAVDCFADFVGHELTTATRRDVEAYRAHLEAAGRAPATIAKVLSALSGYYCFAVDEAAIDRNPVATARRPRIADTSPRRALSPAEVRAILAAPNIAKSVGLRDRALLVSLVVQGGESAKPSAFASRTSPKKVDTRSRPFRARAASSFACRWLP